MICTCTYISITESYVSHFRCNFKLYAFNEPAKSSIISIGQSDKNYIYLYSKVQNANRLLILLHRYVRTIPHTAISARFNALQDGREFYYERE
jgi:hypothetical protein